ncbi:MAG: hypothetical protein CR981_00860 [Proteobacteria bacterium]|nr:MAG: hypothetical protein CR981_00860 [Pseudomonadota bacterium]
MGTCRNHPDRESGYRCMKYGYYLCEECLCCNDLDMFCKARSSCIIYFLTSKKGKELDEITEAGN